MAKSPLLRVLSAAFPLVDFLYLLQLEEYETRRYLARLPRFFFRRGFERRDHLRWTVRTKIMAATTVLLIFLMWSLATLPLPEGPGLPAGRELEGVGGVLLGIVIFCLTPFFIVLANILTTPIANIAHAFVRRKAKARVHAMRHLRIVAIAGSYGKTTTKNLIFSMVHPHFSAQMIEGNINTPTGIARWILKNLQPSTTLLVVEMDAYHPGEIAASCEITPPDIAVLTAIGDQHLVRFGSEDALVRSLAEVFTHAKRDAVRICTERVEEQLQQVSRSAAERVRHVITRPLDHSTTPHSASVHEDMALAGAVAEALGVPERFIQQACRMFVPPERRQRPGLVFGYDGIDDSYNMSNATARAGVLAARTLAKEHAKKLVVLTAGIPELPRTISRRDNTLYGAFLGEHVDGVVLLNSEFAPFVRDGIPLSTPSAIVGNLDEAIRALHERFPVKEYVLLFQPELTDAAY